MAPLPPRDQRHPFLRDPVLRRCHRMMAYNIASRSQAPEKRFAAGRKSEALISGGVAEEALVAPRGGDEDEEMPQAVPPPPRTQGEMISKLDVTPPKWVAAEYDSLGHYFIDQ
nr:hypothetical protein [Tanacetum cinerariifolium]